MDVYSALNISKYITNKCCKDNSPISNLQLQKILYYVQYEFLRKDSLLFNDDFEAWKFGPVVPRVYSEFCGCGGLKIDFEYNIVIDNEVQRIIDPLVEKLRIRGVWDLVRETHERGMAWDKVFRNGLGEYDVIPKDLIKNYAFRF